MACVRALFCGAIGCGCIPALCLVNTNHHRMSKYTQSARDQACQVRIPHICNHNPATVVFAHLNGGGVGFKHLDIHGAYACSDCHAWLDGGYVQHKASRKLRDYYHLEAVIRTQQIMVKNGVLIL